MSARTLTMWAVYDHPTDYPDFFVAREFIDVDGEPVPTCNIVTSESLDVIRAMMVKSGLTCLPREPSDDPVVVETWL